MTEENQPYSLMMIRNGLAEKTTGAKARTFIKRKSDKKLAEEKAERERWNAGGSPKQKWFKNRRKEMSGKCSCGCGEKSQKEDDKFFRSSICHILPQRLFPSVQLHMMNWIELAFWKGCHTTFDEAGMERWPNMACWDEIKRKFKIIDAVIDPEEKKQKFYNELENLIHNN